LTNTLPLATATDDQWLPAIPVFVHNVALVSGAVEVVFPEWLALKRNMGQALLARVLAIGFKPRDVF
jgi:hypothetical protein